MTNWVEKYRPCTFDDVMGNKQLVKCLHHMCKTDNFQHIILHGQPGTGKTSVVHCMIRSMYADMNEDNVLLEMNASDKRKLSDLNKIRSFSKLASKWSRRVVFLDEMESLPSKSQEELLKIMKETQHKLLFILSCNFKSKVIYGIQMMCISFKMQPVHATHVLTKLTHIVQIEDVHIKPPALQFLARSSGGDLRSAINKLQGLYNMYREDIITTVHVQQLFPLSKSKQFFQLVRHIASGDVQKALNIVYSNMDCIEEFYTLAEEALCTTLTLKPETQLRMYKQLLKVKRDTCSPTLIQVHSLLLQWANK